MSILVTLIAVQFQCHAGAPLATFDVFVNDKALTNNSIVVEEIQSITVQKGANASCANVENPLLLEVASPKELPNVPGLYDQTDIRNYTRDLKDSETIVLYELGTRNINSLAADFQDVVLRIDYAHQPEPVAPIEIYPD